MKKTSFTFLRAEWQYLIMANYSIPADLLIPYLPYGTEPDVYNGKVYLSLVGFMFNNTRLLGLRIPFHINFEEVNLRFYVRYHDGNEWRRGVVFIKEIVPRPAIRIVANMVYREKYSSMPMRHFLRKHEGKMELGYHWKYMNRWNRLEAVTDSMAIEVADGSHEQFITEHYWGYSRYNKNTTVEYAVQHPSWKVYPVKSYQIDCDFAGLYGNEFSLLQNANPDSVLVAHGSEVAVLSRRIIRSPMIISK